jgi:glycosyltransferase involved in cell wall biosynthesis
LLFKRALQHALRHASAFVSVSESVADEAAGRLGIKRSRIHVVHNGVSPAFFEATPNAVLEEACRRQGVEPGQYLIVVGSVSTRKNLTPVIEALSPSHGPPLVVVGPDGHGSATVHDLVRARGLEGRVLFTGWVPSADLNALVKGALALLHPSHEEGFGMTPLEGMAAGVPTAVSREGSLPEVVGDASLLTGCDDVEGWRSVIERLVDDEALRADLVRRGRQRVAQFTWERTAERTMEVHRSVLNA